MNLALIAVASLYGIWKWLWDWTHPQRPVMGRLYIDPSDQFMSIYNGSDWVPIYYDGERMRIDR